MSLIVQKFGGTSVGSLERIREVAAKVIQTRNEGHDVVVVVSAMSGETDHLINLAKAIQEQPNPREYAVLLATGEQVSIALLTMALTAQGCSARSYTGSQAHILTDGSYDKARILSIDCQTLREDLAAGCIPVVAGFQGVAENGDITTLGRGGSDTTAVALAAALKADECQIYTDVDGVYTADPRVVPSARRLERVTFEEMLELASVGAKVVQQRAVEFAGKRHVPLRVLSSYVDGPGTLVTFNEKSVDNPVVTGIACNRQEARLFLNSIPQHPEIVANILAELDKKQIEIDMMVQQASATAKDHIDFSFTLSRDEYGKAYTILQKLAHNINASKVVGDTSVAKISLVGIGLRSHPAIIGTLFNCFSSQNIVAQLVSTSEIRVSVLIEEKYLERGVRALHSAYGLEGLAN